ncbi:MAG: hypothetical protein INR68_13100 [Methylobacterium mesophilicum]|nr:hypothetical protein [Methylobacterium mesophilicum]
MEQARDFAALLEELIEAAQPTPLIQPSPSVDYLAAVEEAEPLMVSASAQEAVAAYRDFSLEDELFALIEEKEAVGLIAAPSLAPDDIAAELGIALCRPGDLPQMRRLFALHNHPDRVAPHLRENAEKRMQIANSLIDEALTRFRAGT